jgi:hypothetical protein
MIGQNPSNLSTGIQLICKSLKLVEVGSKPRRILVPVSFSGAVFRILRVKRCSMVYFLQYERKVLQSSPQVRDIIWGIFNG